VNRRTEISQPLWLDTEILVLEMTVDENRFKKLAAQAADAQEIDLLCMAWIRAAATGQAPKVRAMLLAAVEVIRAGLD
jgi:hypothetical protein